MTPEEQIPRTIYTFDFLRCGERWVATSQGRIERHFDDYEDINSEEWGDGVIKVQQDGDKLTIRGHSLNFWDQEDFEHGWSFVRDWLEMEFSEEVFVYPPPIKADERK